MVQTLVLLTVPPVGTVPTVGKLSSAVPNTHNDSPVDDLVDVLLFHLEVLDLALQETGPSDEAALDRGVERALVVPNSKGNQKER